MLTDVLVFRRREDGRQMSDETQDWLDTWVKSLPGKDGKDTDARINGYFVERPENVLGTYEVGNGMYGSSTLKVIPATTSRYRSVSVASWTASSTRPSTTGRPSPRRPPTAP
ncbi:hypothetical protein GS500_23565 [Rhodococcus hoagii]|nr:hypothetical protein [Prescottella equi]